jgi:Sulfotransferase domain
MTPGRGRVLPDYLVIGSPRAGTTSVHGWLEAHPCVAAVQKELLYFNVNYGRGVDWYRSRFPTEDERERCRQERGTALVAGDATASYMLHSLVPARAAELLPQAKLVVCLRDPVDRAYSQFHAGRRRGYEPLDTLAAAVAAEEGRLAGEVERTRADAGYHSRALHVWAYLASSRYAEQLERWYRLFGREQVLLLNFERELTQAPREALARLHAFLGLPPHENAELPVLNMNAGSYPPLDEGVRESLVEYFRPHNRRLYELTGIDFGWPA